MYRAEMACREATYAARPTELAVERRELAISQPTVTVIDTRPATAAQIGYLRTLIGAEPASCFGFGNIDATTRSAASAAIITLKNEA